MQKFLYFLFISLVFSQTTNAKTFEYHFQDFAKVLIALTPEGVPSKEAASAYFVTSYGETKLISDEPIDAFLLPLTTQNFDESREIPKGLHFVDVSNDSQMSDSDFIFLVQRISTGFKLTLVNISGLVFEILLPNKIATVTNAEQSVDQHVFEELIREITLSEIFKYKNEKMILTSLKTNLGGYTFIARDLSQANPLTPMVDRTSFYLYNEKYYGNLKILDPADQGQRSGSERDLDRFDLYVGGNSFFTLNLPDVYNNLLIPTGSAPVESKDTFQAKPTIPLKKVNLPNRTANTAATEVPNIEKETQKAASAPGEVTNPELLVFKSKYTFINDHQGLWLVRLVDQRKIHLSPFPQKLPILYSIENGIVSFHNIPRKVELKFFELESAVLLEPYRETATENGLKDPKEVVKSFFQEVNTTQNKGKYFFSASDEELLSKMVKSFKKPMGRPRSLVLLGEPGTGKTILIRELMSRLPKTWSYYKMEPLALDAGTKWQGAHEERLKAIVELAKQGPLVLHVDELHTLVGSGTHANKSSDTLDQLKTAMGDGQIVIVATDTSDEFNEAFVDDALIRRIPKFDLEEPKGEDLIKKLKFSIEKMNLKLTDDGIFSYLFQKSSEYFPNGHEPDRSQTVIDQIFLNKDDQSLPITIEDVNKAIKELTKRDPNEWTLQGVRKKISDFSKNYKKYISGDTELIDIFKNLTSHFLLGLVHEEGPALKILLAGSHGVGKSSRGEAYAKAMGYNYVTIELNRFRPGSGLHAEQLMSEIAQQLLKDPHSVIVLDEIEKCSIEVQQTLIRILENDYFTARVKTAAGQTRTRKITVRFAKFIATTNAGHGYIERILKKETTSIGFVDANQLAESTDFAIENAFSKVDQAAFKKVLKESIEPAIVDRFAGWYGVYVIPVPGPAVLKKILGLKLAQQIKHLTKFMSLNVKFRLKGLNSLLDKYVQRVGSGGANVRDAIKDIFYEIRTQIAQEILSSPEITEAQTTPNSPPKRTLTQSFSTNRCLPLFK